MAVTACEADIVALTGVTFSQGGTGRWIAEVAPERLERIELNALLQRVIVTDDRAKAAEDLARQWAPMTAAEILESPFVVLGTVDEIVEALTRRRQRWDISYYVAMEPALETFAPIVARLAGT